jgi:8-amino-7-oxononanoate synthase
MATNRKVSPSSARDAWLARLDSALVDRQSQHLLRQLQVVQSAQGPTLQIDGREFVQFCTNNYLGLANDPEVIDAARRALDRFGAGAGASRLVAGSMQLHHELEAQLARFKHTDAALLFPTGYMANLAALTTFAGDADRIVSDKLNHASLLDAARFSGAEHRTFPHKNYRRAAGLLQRADVTPGKPGVMCQAFLVTDSIFSMDGDIADLPTLCAVADQHHALVIIDEAHATGVLGPTGAGLAEQQGCCDRIALHVGTLSKALGSIGGFIAGPQAAIDPLINTARPFIYTTALPPACSAASLASLNIIQREPQRRQRVMQLAGHVKAELIAMGFDCQDSQSPIIPVILGSADNALAAAALLRDRAIYVPAIRPPTVPPNSARLRISLMSSHTDAHIEQLLDAMRALREQRSDHGFHGCHG